MSDEEEPHVGTTSEQKGSDKRDPPEKHDEDHDHGHHEYDLDAVGVAIVTVSSSRSFDDDPSGDAIAEIFEAESHDVVTREIVDDDFDGIQSAVNRLVDRDDTDAVVTTGGTGVTPDDVTVEAIQPLLAKHLPGFGELFRRRSEDDIGSRVVATRATAGIAHDVPVFCLPGSEAAVRLGVEEIIVPQVGHIAGLADRDE